MIAVDIEHPFGESRLMSFMEKLQNSGALKVVAKNRGRGGGNNLPSQLLKG